ncbi:MAG: type 1 glutamine amidotransferase domain-containing protein [Bacteroidota bacterium]
MKRHILIIASNPAKSTTTGWPVGFWLSEVTHPMKIFKEAGYVSTLASPKGGKIEVDAMSDPNDESKRSEWDMISKQYLEDPEFTKLLENTPSVRDQSIDDYDAVVVAGGMGPLFTFEGDEDLISFFTAFYKTGKVTCALCHGVAILRYAVLSDGIPLVKGKKVTGFTNGEEDESDQFAGQKVMPWRIEDELNKLGAEFYKKGNWEPFAISDGNLVTGQQNMSGEVTAKKIVELLEK